MSASESNLKREREETESLEENSPKKQMIDKNNDALEPFETYEWLIYIVLTNDGYQDAPDLWVANDLQQKFIDRLIEIFCEDDRIWFNAIEVLAHLTKSDEKWMLLKDWRKINFDRQKDSIWEHEGVYRLNQKTLQKINGDDGIIDQIVNHPENQKPLIQVEHHNKKHIARQEKPAIKYGSKIYIIDESYF